MTRECSDALASSPYHRISEVIEKCDTPINTKLQSDSAYHPAKYQLKTHFREQKLHSNIDVLTTDVRTIQTYTGTKTHLAKKLESSYEL